MVVVIDVVFAHETQRQPCKYKCKVEKVYKKKNLKKFYASHQYK